MEDLRDKFDHVYIHGDAWASPVAERVRAIFYGNAITRVDSEPRRDVRGRLSGHEFSRSKREMFITPFRGRFFKRCPGSRPGLMCCNYFVLNLGSQCDMNCSYCYLQSFINFPFVTIYSNIDQAIAELGELHRDLHSSRVRIGTGEVIDSLSLDPLTLYSRKLIKAFRDFPRWTLEFKTKSAAVDQFLDEPHGGNVIVSWSINPEPVVKHEEHGTATLAQRLDAARRCLDRGFQVAFHLDPMIFHPNWRENYGEMVDAIASRFKPEEIPYMSLGALRFQPEQRSMMRERFKMQSWVNQAEVFPSTDGKMRYDRNLRGEMFEFVLDRLRRHSRAWRVFLCMETPETWATTMGQSPHRDEQLAPLFTTDVLAAHRRWASSQEPSHLS